MSTRPWWKYPLVWFVIALPASMVVIGLWLLSVATQNRDAVVTAHPYETGLKAGDAVRKAQAAASMHLSGQISSQAQTMTVRLVPAPSDAAVQIHLEHPFSAKGDLDAVMRRTGVGVYEGAFALQPVLYSVQLQTSTWSVSGHWKPGSTAKLTPGSNQPTGNPPPDD